jgi:serine/threonine-protein kinase
MIRGKILPGALLSAALLALPSVSAAQSASDKAAAEALFDDGVTLLKAGKYQEASQRLEASQRIDPGIGTLLYLAEAYEKLGRTASAWATFREAASQAKAEGQTDRASIGAERAARLTPKLSRLTLTLAPETQNIAGLEILDNGKPIQQALWGSALPVDPGEHKIEARAPGYEPYNTSLTIAGDAQNASAPIPALTKNATAPAAPAPSEPEPPSAAVSTSSPEPLALDPNRGSFQRTAGIVVAGVGVVGLGVGTFFGLQALNKNDEALDKNCDGATCPDQDGVNATNDALDAANISNIAFIAGGVCVLGGAALYFTAPDPEEKVASLPARGFPTPRLERLEMRPTVGGAALGLGGSF